MKRFILLAFGFLALAFFELSGGSDFDPAATRQSSIEMRQQLEASRRANAATMLAALPAVTGRAPIAAQAAEDDGSGNTSSLNLVSYNSVTNPQAGSLPEITSTDAKVADLLDTETSDTISDEVTTKITLTTPAVIGISETRGLAPDTGTISVAGLSAPASSRNAELPQIIDRPSDVRVVSGSLVNLRAGPGTTFEVVAQLSENTRVEILEDAGNGWVNLRPIGGGPVGWMADYLLADG